MLCSAFCVAGTSTGTPTPTPRRPSLCEYCRSLVDDPECSDQGWFGNHTKGVYLSKHADYTFWYSGRRDPVPGDSGRVVMLEVVTGRVCHFAHRRDGAHPTAGYHCHESPNNLEFYVWDTNTTAEPPTPTYRAIPKYVISWKAVKDRGNIKHDA